MCRLVSFGHRADRQFQTHRKPKTEFDPKVNPFRADNSNHRARHAAAMVFIPELEANLSPPVQYEGMLNLSSNARASSISNHQRHTASTHFAGSDQKSLVIVADRRFQSHRKPKTKFDPGAATRILDWKSGWVAPSD